MKLVNLYFKLFSTIIFYFAKFSGPFNIHVQYSIMFKGVQDVLDVQDSKLLYQLISNGHSLYLYAFKMFCMFIYIIVQIHPIRKSY